MILLPIEGGVRQHAVDEEKHKLTPDALTVMSVEKLSAKLIAVEACIPSLFGTQFLQAVSFGQMLQVEVRQG